MRIWYRINCTECESEKVLRTLWVPQDVFAIVPVDSWVYLPTPKEWVGESGKLSGVVTGYVATGCEIECDVDLVAIGFDEGEDFAEMLAIGYVDKEPQEIVDAYNSLSC